MNHVMRNDADDLTTHILSTCRVSIVYSNTATTAMYDPQSQELILPMFPLGKMGRLMLRFHEISHAMETPREWNHQIVATPFRHPKLAGRKVTQAAWDFMYKIVAVLEDIRIERAFCKRYRGAYHIMRAGHVELLDMGFYNDPSGEKFDPSVIPTLPLHSRMLLAERLPHLLVRFPDKAEADLYDRATRLPNFEAVQDLAVDIFIHTFREPPKQPQMQNPQSKPSKGKGEKGERQEQNSPAPPQMPEDLRDTEEEQDEESESQDGDGKGKESDEKSDNEEKSEDEKSDSDGQDEKSEAGDEGEDSEDDSDEKSDGDKSEGEDGSDGESSDGLKADEDSESSDSEGDKDDEKSNEGQNEKNQESDGDGDALDRANSDEGQDELEQLLKDDLLDNIDDNLEKAMAKTADLRQNAGAVMIETASRLKKAHKAMSVLDVMRGRAQFKYDTYGNVVGVGDANTENFW